jgi:hypothetical protein
LQTPLYKKLKDNGTSFYAFPGAAEDISAAYQNQNYKMYFSKYTLLDFPKENLVNLGGTQAQHTYFDFGTFSGIAPSLASTYKDRVIESLRNYVGNHEVSLRESRLNNTEYYYDTRALETTSEKIFFKWCKKLNLIDFEPAVPQDEYFDTLTEFDRNNQNDDSYFPEYLWKEREIVEWSVVDYFQTSSPLFTGFLELETTVVTNIQVGDIIDMTDFEGPLTTEIFGSPTWFSVTTEVLDVTTSGGQQNIIVDISTFVSGGPNVNIGTIKVVYNKLIQYIGEVNGVSNVQEANKAYTEVYAHIPDHTGQTPDILFRTKPDINYKPNLVFPIIPAQYQPEIIGAELFSSPIVSNPTEYPGSYYAQFDTIDFTYEVESGDSVRRSGRFYGVTGDINTPATSGKSLDGVIIDFNNDHYAKMNINDREVSNFDEFNALEINNSPATDFEFNAILWYYTVEDQNGNKITNLYGVSFLDNPENNPKDEEVDIRFPVYKKLVTNGSQDGTSYAFGLNLNFNIIHDNPQEAYNPEAINSLFSMNLYNEAMRRLSSVNESFLNIISDNIELKDEVTNIKQLLYSQTDLDMINAKISNLEDLLKLYSTMQITTSETIEVEYTTTSPATVKLNNIDRNYHSIDKYLSSNMYNTNGAIPINITPPQNKNFLINIHNDDTVDLDLLNDDKLSVLFTTDLQYKQSIDILITGDEISTENKKLDIYITTVNPLNSSTASEIVSEPIETLLISDIDLPVLYNNNTSQPNSASTWKGFDFNIDFTSNITLQSGYLIDFILDANANIVNNAIKVGDVLVLNNMFVGTASVFDFSGQYKVEAVNGTTLTINISDNAEFVSYFDTLTLPFALHSSTTTFLSNNPYFSLNKGYKISVTRISSADNILLTDKYSVNIQDAQY